MTSSSPSKHPTLFAVVALLGAIASVLTALLGSDGLASVLPFLSHDTSAVSDDDTGAVATDPPMVNQAIDGGGQGCVVGHVGPNSTVNCEATPQPTSSTFFPPQPGSLIPANLDPGQPTLPTIPENFGTAGEFPALSTVDTTAPRSWCLGLQEQWSARNDLGRDGDSIRASFDDANCASHGLSMP